MADHPFSNAGLGMFGAGESGAKAAMQQGIQAGLGGKDGMGLAGFLAGLIGLTPPKQPGQAAETAPVSSGSEVVAPPPQYEPQTAFPDVLQQQYASPYISGSGSAMPPPTTSLQGFMTQPYRAPAPADPMAGFKTPNQFTATPQKSASGYHPTIDEIWGK